jgi:hypothetical protein
MKLTLKLFLVICLFSSVTFADGDMTGGGFAEGDMTGGGLTSNDQTQKNSILIFVQEYLRSIFG